VRDGIIIEDQGSVFIYFDGTGTHAGRLREEECCEYRDNYVLGDMQS